MVKIMENPIKTDDLEGTPILGGSPIFRNIQIVIL